MNIGHRGVPTSRIALVLLAVTVSCFVASCDSAGSGATTLWAGTGDGAHQVASGRVEEMLAKGARSRGSS